MNQQSTALEEYGFGPDRSSPRVIELTPVKVSFDTRQRLSMHSDWSVSAHRTLPCRHCHPQGTPAATRSAPEIRAP